jgi:hypothetical protein
MSHAFPFHASPFVIPAKAGISLFLLGKKKWDSSFRWNDGGLGHIGDGMTRRALA